MLVSFSFVISAVIDSTFHGPNGPNGPMDQTTSTSSLVFGQHFDGVLVLFQHPLCELVCWLVSPYELSL